MSIGEALPRHVADAIVAANYIEFATLTKAAVPIDTPCLSYPAADLSTINVTTGLAYPAKADRLRRNPKTGLWINGQLPGEPTISIVGFGAAHDADVGSNALEYISETGSYGAGASADWSLARKAVWYWSRIIMRIVPAEILWWDHGEDLDREPQRWQAPADTAHPASDPAPAGEATSASGWRQPPWEMLAANAISRGAVGHLSLVDADGFPRPMRVWNLDRSGDGFVMDAPPHVPGERNGPASLSFQGLENFVGRASVEGGRVHLRVERALPLLPLMNNPQELWEPTPETRAKLMERLEAELSRRGQTIPHLPEQKPAPTAEAHRRRERVERLQEEATQATSAGPGRGWSVPDA